MATAATLSMPAAASRVFVAPAPGGGGRDAPALASRVDAHGGRRDDAGSPAGVDGGDTRPALAASVPVRPRLLQFASASGTRPSARVSWSSPARTSAAEKAIQMPPKKVMNDTMKKKKTAAQARRQSVDVLIDWTAKLLVLPFVGASLCGALTLMVGVQWVEAVRRRELSGYGTSLASLWALMPALSLPSRQLLDVYGYESDADDNDISDNGDNEHHSQPARSPSARPVKRQRSGNSASDGSEADDGALVSRQPKPRSPLTSVSPRPTDAPGSKRRRRRRRVFIWDLDETLVLFASLYTGSFAQTHGKEVAPGVALGEQMMTFLLAMLERHFFFGDLHDTDVDHIACAEGARCLNCRRLRAASSSASLLSQETGDYQEEAESALERERKTRYRRIRDIYEQRGHVDFLHDDQSEWFAIRVALVQAIDSFSTGWLQEARQVLALIEASNVTRSSGVSGRPSGMLRNASTVSLDGERSSEEDGPVTDPTLEQEDEEQGEEEEVENVNVLVTNTQLVPALCKCLVYELDVFFPIERIYSSAKVHKYRCFEAIMAKYRTEASEDGDEDVAVEFVAIGDGLEEEQVSLALGLEFHKIRSLVDLRRLRYDLQLVDSAPVSSFVSLSSPISASNNHIPTARTPMPTMAVAVDTQEQ